MSDPPKPKFKKVKLPQTTLYRKIEVEHKKYILDLRLTKLDQNEKEGVDVSLQTKLDQKIKNLTLRHGVNTSLIEYTSYTHFD